jgi:quercetin dioxygenase-like cupin family protein|tara:strand:- start:54 stop:503 length:450 start_codon:yes stop_codon:yes gene_type:complete
MDKSAQQLSIYSWDVLSVEDRRAKILELEAYSKTQPQVELPPIELFGNGLYLRALKIPKNTVLVGEIHLQETMNIVMYGEIVVATDEGVKTIYGGDIFNSPAGTKRAGVALEDTYWLVIHATESTDIDKIKEEFIAPNYEALSKHLEKM